MSQLFVLQKNGYPELFWAEFAGWRRRKEATVTAKPWSPSVCQQLGGTVVSAEETDPRCHDPLWPHFVHYAEPHGLDLYGSSSHELWEVFVAGVHKGVELAAHQQLAEGPAHAPC